MSETNKQQALFEILLRLGDNSLVIGHRLSEWCSKGPILEEDLALANIALDCIGQARLLLTYAGETEGKGRSEDDLAYGRLSADYRNALLAEQPNGDFGVTIARQLYYTVFADLCYSALRQSTDAQLAGIAAKAHKEIQYHLRHCTEWTLRLGDGTEESHRRMQKGIDELWMYTGDLFASTEADAQLVAAGIIPDIASLHGPWKKQLESILSQATLTLPPDSWMQKGSREGVHTEALSYLLGEMQTLTRAYPGVNW
ncbi:MAG: phenylacetate-CoA oxygenase subunit PaaC [Bacteroidetes bacterium]|nr:phenylacetate-CoA oxygenase subunit PaaC [Bacteroidota bacterium]